MHLLIESGWLILGFAMLIKGADWFVDGASAIAKRYGISQLVIGLTIVAMGTSLPEAAISISAALKGSSGIAVGNVLGSNILNVLLILGVSAVIMPISVRISVTRREIPFLLLISILLPALGLIDGSLSHGDGALLLFFFILYIAWLFKTSGVKKSSTDKEKPTENIPMWRCCLPVLIGGALVIFGSNTAVDAASDIARTLGMNDRLIGLTIIAIGTSLPELVTGSMAAMKGNSDMALGNIVGSNLFNILFVLGASAVIKPIAYPMSFLADSMIGIATCLLLLSLLIRDAKLQRSNGIIMLVGFAFYYLWLFLA